MNNIKLKKIYISGLNMSGKGQLLQLLDGHPNIFIFPFHKFGISYDIESFILYFRKKVFLNKDFENSFHLYDKKANFNEYISIQNLISYILNLNSAGPDLIMADISKLCTAYAGDSYTEQVKINFSLDIFIDNLRSFQIKNIQKKISFENLEDYIFISFIKSVEEYKKFDFNNDYFALFAGNGPNHVKFLNNYFINYLNICVKRDLLNRLYSNSKRHLSDRKLELNKINLFHSMIRALKSYIKQDQDLDFMLEKLKNLNSKNLIINFDDILNDKESLMKNISSFLKISFNKNLLEPTFMREKLFLHEDNIIIENDKIDNHFSDYEIQKIKKLSASQFFLNIYVFAVRILNKIFNIKLMP
tara:strand:- start:336 stop:1412 length:1077 start_codon:yes stop_codon:yes gene_type:complete